jgi:hypothetical protein
MKYFIALILLSFTSYSKAQSVEPKSPAIKPVQREFKNQGEQEDYWAERLFAREYKVQIIEKYNGPIIIGANGTYRYGDKVLTVSNTNDTLKAIFEKGFFLPQLIFGPPLQPEFFYLTVEVTTLDINIIGSF